MKKVSFVISLVLVSGVLYFFYSICMYPFGERPLIDSQNFLYINTEQGSPLSVIESFKEKDSINVVVNNRIRTSIDGENDQMVILDTFLIDNYNFLVFRPNENEFQELMKKQDHDGSLYEVDSDFGFYINTVLDSLSKTDLRVKFISERIIKYSTKEGSKSFDRLKNQQHPYGIIFNKKGCESKIYFGIMSDVGILQELNDYIEKCN